MIFIQSLTFLGVAFLISWAFVIGGYYGGFVEVPMSLVILSLSMTGPALSALLCVQLFGPGLKSIQWTPHFKRSIWWVYAWLIPVAFTFLSMAITLFGAPDAHLQFTINDVEIGPLILLQAFILGPLINTPVLTFTEELGWRGYLYDLWRPFGFWVSSIATGLIWGFWHAPGIFFYGVNYPEHPVMGIALFMVWCALLSPIIMIVREKTGSVWAAGLFHGTLNALGGLSVVLMGNPGFPWKGPVGLGGFCLLLIGVAAIKLSEKSLELKKTACFKNGHGSKMIKIG